MNFFFKSYEIVVIKLNNCHFSGIENLKFINNNIPLKKRHEIIKLIFNNDQQLYYDTSWAIFLFLLLFFTWMQYFVRLTIHCSAPLCASTISHIFSMKHRHTHKSLNIRFYIRSTLSRQGKRHTMRERTRYFSNEKSQSLLLDSTHSSKPFVALTRYSIDLMRIYIKRWKDNQVCSTDANYTSTCLFRKF